MVPVYRSRFTPGLENGKDVSFKVGEVVTYKKIKNEEIVENNYNIL